MRRGGPILVLACTISYIANLKIFHRQERGEDMPYHISY